MRVLFALSLAAALALAGCGVPQEPGKQAEELHSVAAEAVLLAHDAAEGSTTETFTREHAKALRERLGELRPAIEDGELARRADAVDAALTGLVDAAADREQAARLERRLRELAG